jgi:hypothetical protein
MLTDIWYARTFCFFTAKNMNFLFTQALQWHPERNKGTAKRETAALKFIEVGIFVNASKWGWD